jgi:hypothetical protein
MYTIEKTHRPKNDPEKHLNFQYRICIHNTQNKIHETTFKNNLQCRKFHTLKILEDIKWQPN